MTSTQVLDLKGNKVRELTLKEEVFASQPNAGVVHSALVRQLANARSGAANTKTRSEVRGGGAKPWRQKGTGRARAGSRRSPLWEGGGVTFGPKPRDYGKSMPKKVRLLAIRSALAAKRNNLVIVKDFKDLKEAKTKEAVQIFRALKIDGKRVLVVLDYQGEESNRFALAARNIEDVRIVHVNNVNVKDLLNCEALLASERAVEALSTRLTPAAKVEYKPVNRVKPTAKVEKPVVKESKPAASKAHPAQTKSEADLPLRKIATVSKESAPPAESKAKPAKADEAEAKAKTPEAETKKVVKKEAPPEEAPSKPVAKKKEEAPPKKEEAPAKKPAQTPGKSDKKPEAKEDSKAKKKPSKE
ncbi:MAG: 50S ribosomal protein L4 [Candidatus Melainabacteria bacterium]|nr:MAG: 50S ribosomal protein L4 [Candidatus Melainabacteria bacterium]